MDIEPLSEAGQIRRQQILTLAKGAARHRRQRRLFVLAGQIGAGATLGITLVLIFGRQISMPVPAGHSIAKVETLATQPSSIAIEYLQTDPAITDRLTIKPQPPSWTNIDDSQLLQELADAGQPAGIVCMNGKTLLLPRN